MGASGRSLRRSLEAGLRDAPHCSGAGLWLPSTVAALRDHSCIKLLIFVSSTSVSDSGETQRKQTVILGTIPQPQAKQPEKQV